MAEFLYPLPKEYYDQTTSDTAATAYYSRSYHGAHTYSGHGRGKLDLNCSNGTLVRAMTDGIVVKTGKDNSSSYHSINIKTTGHYLGYDPNLLVPAWTDQNGILVIRYYHTGNYKFSVGDRVKQGDIIATVGDPAVSSGPHLHLDFSYSEGGFSPIPAMGTLINYDGSGLANDTQRAAYQRWLRDGGDQRGRCWEVILSDAVWKEPGSSSAKIIKNNIAYVENMNQEAVDCYISGTFSDNWMGKYPETLDDLKNNIACRGLRYATAICSMELSFDGFSNVAYGKLLRAKMIGEKHSGNNMKEWFEGLNRYQFDRPEVWKAKTNLNLEYAQLIYKNIKYPELYGTELSQDEEIKRRWVYAYQQIPVYNLTPPTYLPHAFCIYYRPKNRTPNPNTDYLPALPPFAGTMSNPGSYYGTLCLYRQKNGDMLYFNQKVIQ